MRRVWRARSAWIFSRDDRCFFLRPRTFRDPTANIKAERANAHHFILTNCLFTGGLSPLCKDVHNRVPMGIIVTADCFIEGLRRADLGRCDFREEFLEDIALTCSRLIGSRSFDFVVNCKHCITVFDGCLSLAPVLGLADDWRTS